MSLFHKTSSEFKIELCRKDQLLDIDLLTHLKHCSLCLSAKHGFTCSLEQGDLEEQLEQVVALPNLLTAT